MDEVFAHYGPLERYLRVSLLLIVFDPSIYGSRQTPFYTPTASLSSGSDSIYHLKVLGETMDFSRDICNYAILYAKTGSGNCGAIFSQRHCGNVKK
jgi:hypothetical protein